jgi:glycosyltransferase involved in cell wall biosynthesis
MTDQIRVLYYYPFLNFDTGSPKALAQMIDTLDRSTFQPVYYASGEGPLVDALRARDVEIVPGTASDLSVCHPLQAIAAVRRQAALLKEWDIHLLHANCFPWNTDVVLAAWMLRIPVILHVHNAVDIVAQNLVRFAAAKVLFCSAFQMKNCGHVSRIAGKTGVFHNVIDLNRFGLGRSIRDDLGLRNDQIVIGTIAQVTHRKGIDILLEAARLLLNERSDLVFLVAGPLVDNQKDFGEMLMRQAEQEPLKGRFRFLGSRSDIPNILASMDLFVLPSRLEPMGIVVLEAMASGVPVVASRVGGVPEMLTSSDLGVLVDPLTPEAFAGAIRAVLARPDRGRSIGQRAKAMLEGRFDLAAGRKRLHDFYFEVLPPSARACVTTSPR